MKYIISALIGYLIGSINSAILISALYKTDIRKHGSGNAGATNVLRTFGKGAAAAVTIFDIAKGIVAILITRLIFGVDSLLPYITGCAAVLGHNFPLYFGFKGGKGVLTSLGVILMLDWRAGLIILAVGIAVIALSRYVSLGSCAAALSLPVAALILRLEWMQIIIFALMAALAVFMHRTNISRLLSGTERKLGEKK